MLRVLITAALVAFAVFLGATLVARAYDHEVQQHVVLTRNGVTLDCERITDVVGNVFYDSCVRVP